jgi:DNA-binding PadR family transcriptional regulator
VRLTTPMRDALAAAQHAPLRRAHRAAGADPLPAPAATLRALIRHGLLDAGSIRNRHGDPVDTWTITDAGRAALAPREVFRQDRPTFLVDHRRAGWVDPTSEERHDDDYTSDPRKRVDELEVIDPDTQRIVTVRGRRNDAQRQTLDEAGRASQGLEDRLARARAEARDRGVDVARIEASILRRIEALERRVGRRAA